MHKAIERTSTISRDDGGKTLLSFLVKRFTYLKDDGWLVNIKERRVTVNGKSCTGNETLLEGDIVAFTPEPYDEPPVSTAYAILAEDDDFLFVDKPALLPCHPGGIYLFNTLWALLRDSREYVSFVNRLDRETSGIVIVAKNPDAARYAGIAMSDHRITKEYQALVEGHFSEEIDAKGFLESDPDSPIRKKLRFIPEHAGDRSCSDAGLPGTKPLDCRTFFSPGKYREEGTTLVKARLFTGRTHQIRATLEALGYPIVGDKLYGRDPTIFLRFIEGTMTERDKAVLRLEHQALHCSHLVLPKRDGGEYDIRSDASFC